MYLCTESGHIPEQIRNFLRKKKKKKKKKEKRKARPYRRTVSAF